MKHDPASSLLAKIHVPDDFPHVIYRRENRPGFPPDLSLFTLMRQGGLLQTFAAWEPFGSKILQGGQTGIILIVPLWPDLWRHLREGDPLVWAHEPFSAQIVVPLNRENAP